MVLNNPVFIGVIIGLITGLINGCVTISINTFQSSREKIRFKVVEKKSENFKTYMLVALRVLQQYQLFQALQKVTWIL